MLLRPDLEIFFNKLPKNFKLIINNNNYNCSKLCLNAFSQLISDKLKMDPNLDSYTINIDAKNENIRYIIDFLHGGPFEPSDSEFFDFYYIAASLGIDIIRKRLYEAITKLIAPENVKSIYEKISQFPNFCLPLVRFFDENPSFFNDFIKNNILKFDFIDSLLANSTQIFETENKKYDFIKNLLDSSKSPDYSICKYIYPEKLSEDALDNFLQNLENHFQNTLCFTLIKNLLNKKRDLLEILNSHQLQLKSAQNDLQIKKKKNDSHKKETSESSNKVHQAVKVEEEVLSNIQLISDRLEYIAADIALLSLQNQTTKNLLSKIENLYNICNEIKQGIWLVVTPWQGSNVRAAGELADAVKGIRKLSTVFEPDPELLCTFSQPYIRIAENLRKIEISPTI